MIALSRLQQQHQSAAAAVAPAAAEPATAVAEELHWAGLPEEDLLEPLEEVVRMQDEDVGVEIEDDTPPRYPPPWNLIARGRPPIFNYVNRDLSCRLPI